jgi:hypothetical protein
MHLSRCVGLGVHSELSANTEVAASQSNKVPFSRGPVSCCHPPLLITPKLVRLGGTFLPFREMVILKSASAVHHL